MKERLESVIYLTKTTPQQTTEIFNLYRELINPKFVGCSSCPASVRQAWYNLKQYYIINY